MSVDQYYEAACAAFEKATKIEIISTNRPGTGFCKIYSTHKAVMYGNGTTVRIYYRK